MNDVFTMSADIVLDEKLMDIILSAGYSRIPVYAQDNTRKFIGILLVRTPITYNRKDCLRVRDFALAILLKDRPDTSCPDIINFFRDGKSHMDLVSDTLVNPRVRRAWQRNSRGRDRRVDWRVSL
jgi:metal transporter CNNM